LRAQPELPTRDPQVPRWRNHAIKLDRPACDDLRCASVEGADSAVGVAAGAGTLASAPGSQIGSSSRCSSGTGWKRSAGVTGAPVSSA
jgi:hypothetical protein